VRKETVKSWRCTRLASGVVRQTRPAASIARGDRVEELAVPLPAAAAEACEHAAGRVEFVHAPVLVADRVEVPGGVHRDPAAGRRREREAPPPEASALGRERVDVVGGHVHDDFARLRRFRSDDREGEGWIRPQDLALDPRIRGHGGVDTLGALPRLPALTQGRPRGLPRVRPSRRRSFWQAQYARRTAWYSEWAQASEPRPSAGSATGSTSNYQNPDFS
jgi:hypothetical protein